MPPNFPVDLPKLLMAMNPAEAAMQIGDMDDRLKTLSARLAKYDFAAIASTLGGLLALPENHASTLRIEALCHLAAYRSCGSKLPTAANFREWLNDFLRGDVLANMEDPVEDVFVSNVATWFGNARIFEGIWEGNDFYLQNCLGALVELGTRPWVPQARRSVIALLKLSEEIAKRAGVERFQMSDQLPRKTIRVTTPILKNCAANVTFATSELYALGIDPRELDPFIFDTSGAAALSDQTIGHTMLERRPLVRSAGSLVVALPTAVSAAVRRFIVDTAIASGELDRLHRALARLQFQDLFHLGCTGWRIRPLGLPKEEVDLGIHEFAGTFDVGAYVHVVFVHDSLEEAADGGLQGTHSILDALSDRIATQATELSKKVDYRRGMTLLVHGGIGRGFLATFSEAPKNWQNLALSLHDFMLLAWDDDFSALRAWKLLEQQDALAARDIHISNLNGFPNLYAYAEHQQFEIVPAEMDHGFLSVAASFIAPLRRRLRQALDSHVALSPENGSWTQVQRDATTAFFKEVRDQPIYVSPAHVGESILLGCVETSIRPWWVECSQQHVDDTRQRSVAFQIWNMALSWLVRAAAVVEGHYPNLPAGPIRVTLIFPDIDMFAKTGILQDGEPVPPKIEVSERHITMTCHASYLRAFAHPKNVGDRMMISAIAAGASKMAGMPANASELDGLVNEVVANSYARFFHMVPAHGPREMIYATIELPRERLVASEDRFWSKLGLAREAGHTGGPGSISNDAALKLIASVVDVVWDRIKQRLANLDRASVIERAITNHDAIEKDRAQWRTTAAALVALYSDRKDVLTAATERESQRGLAALASRIIVEMALCTSPVGGGKTCTNADLDTLMADVATLVEAAYERDAIYYGLTDRELVVRPNGTFSFDTTFITSVQRPYMNAHGERVFMAAADEYDDAFRVPQQPDETTKIDETFEGALRGELGLSLVELFKFVLGTTEVALERNVPLFRMRRSQLQDLIAKYARDGKSAAKRAAEAFSLLPRPRWDERKPKNAEARDWYPWRYDRRLSLVRRPLIQLTDDDDAEVLISPTLIDRCARYLTEAYSGRVPNELFTSGPLRRWIGAAVHRDGLQFNVTVYDALLKLGLKARVEVKLTELGGSADLGDIDVLAWRSEAAKVYLVECKRLSFARTIGEIGERLHEYTKIGSGTDKRTPIQKHLDRVEFLRNNPEHVCRLTGINAGRLVMKSCLVTDYLVPMQFSRQSLGLIDIVTDVTSVHRVFSA